jgi:hypothetical protein
LKGQRTATLGLAWFGSGNLRKARGKKRVVQNLENFMEDILWIAITIAFFVLSIAYVRFCDRVK